MASTRTKAEKASKHWKAFYRKCDRMRRSTRDKEDLMLEKLFLERETELTVKDWNEAFRVGNGICIYTDGSYLSWKEKQNPVPGMATSGTKINLKQTRTATWDGKKWKISVDLQHERLDPMHAWDEDAWNDICEKAHEPGFTRNNSNLLAEYIFQCQLHGKVQHEVVFPAPKGQKYNRIQRHLREWISCRQSEEKSLQKSMEELPV